MAQREEAVPFPFPHMLQKASRAIWCGAAGIGRRMLACHSQTRAPRCLRMSLHVSNAGDDAVAAAACRPSACGPAKVLRRAQPERLWGRL